MEDSRSVSGWIGSQEILTGQILTVDEVIAVIESITCEDLKKIANQILVGNGLHLAAVGPSTPTATGKTC